MANMSYCRFQNTLADLKDCYQAMDEGDENSLSEEELKAKNKLLTLCGQIHSDYGTEAE